MASLILRNKSLVRQASSSIPKLTRGFASHTIHTVVEVPIQIFGIEGRYATALYTAAVKKETLSTVEAEIQQIKRTVAKDPNLWEFFEDPSLSVQNKKHGVEFMLKGKNYSQIVKNFFMVLAENGRLNKTPSIIDAYLELMTAHRGEVPVDVVSAKALDSKVLDRLKNALSKSNLIKSNQKLIINNKVDPGILGGLIVHIGNEKTIDVSTRAQVAKLNKLLSENI